MENWTSSKVIVYRVRREAERLLIPDFAIFDV